MDRRCAGLPFVSTRDLSPAEVAFLKDRYVRARKKTNTLLFWAIFMPIAWPFSVALSDQISDWLGLVFGLGMLVAVAVCWLRWGDSRKISRLAGEASRSTEVEIFHGVPDETLAVEDKWLALQKSGFDWSGSEQTIERLCPALVVLSVNGSYVNYLFRVASSEVAGRPTRQPLFPDRVPAAALHVPAENRRSLTSSEINELEKHAKAFKLRAPWFQLSLGVYFSIIGLVKTISPTSLSDRLFGLALMIFFVGMWAALFAMGFVRSRSIRKDIQAGLVFRLEDPTVMEFLPCSRLIWSVEGTPSLWRHHMSRDVRSDFRDL